MCCPNIALIEVQTLSIASANLLACLQLLKAFQCLGLENLVLCPGSRSGPLAFAAGKLAGVDELRLFTSVDERSAAFLGLGLSAASGGASAVVTTSGTAVANLLPAAVEADRSNLPLLLLTADRPSRLKNCGANQTVNQEDFLRPVCRHFCESPIDGLHSWDFEQIDLLVKEAWQMAHEYPGPVHLNLPIDEPLHATRQEQNRIWSTWLAEPQQSKRVSSKKNESFDLVGNKDLIALDPKQPGVVVIGPWRGSSHALTDFQSALYKWQKFSGWPIFADPLAGVSKDQPGLIPSWDLLLPNQLPIPSEGLQVLRLGPLPASRSLEAWLRSLGEGQLLITEGDERSLDPLKLSQQWCGGLSAWWEAFWGESSACKSLGKSGDSPLLKKWQEIDRLAQAWLDDQLPLQGPVNEPTLARWLPRLLPLGMPLMLAASSPVRDWLSFSGLDGLIRRRCFAFRGASGIDGTLSLGMGLSLSLGPMVLVSGDLALLHDSNGWLFANPLRPPLVVILIDNQGGGIFRQLELETDSAKVFDELFAMPQSVDQLEHASAFGIPHRQVACLEDLATALEWGIAQSGPVLLKVNTQSLQDANLRKALRQGLLEYLKPNVQNGFTDL